MPPKKKEQEKGTKGGKGNLSVNLKDLVPQELKQTPREPRLGQKVIANQESIEKQEEFIQCDQPEEWPGDDFAGAQDMGIQSGIQYVDNVKLQLPKSFQASESQLIFWRRPREYLYEEIMDEIESKGNKSLTLRQKMQKIVKTKSSLQRLITRRSTIETMGFNDEVQDDLSPHLKKRPSKIDDGENNPTNVNLTKEERRKEWAQKTLTIFNVSQRLETQEEQEIRKQANELKEQQQSKDAPKGKKGAVEVKKEEEEVARKVEEVVLSSMEMGGDGESLPQFSLWVASIFQLIKDRQIVDSFSQQKLHSKIYPQNGNGSPIYNDAGQYWVKLYHMGRMVKIEIDDKIPCSIGKTVSLFPKSGSSCELWPMLFTKALLKLQQLYMIDNANYQKETGLGWILYSLMGLVPQNIPLKQLTDEQWLFIQQKTRDKEFNNKQCYITLYSPPNFKPFLDLNVYNSQRKPSNTQMFKKLTQTPHRQMGRNTTMQNIVSSTPQPIHKSLSPLVSMQSQESQVDNSGQSLDEFNSQKEDKKLKYKPNYTQTGFCYSVINSLFNENFNMVYTKERSEEEIKLRENYYNLSKVNLQRMSKEGKLDHRRMKKEMKEKIQVQEKERIELITGSTVQYRMLKVNSRVQKVAQLNYVSPFSEKEIYIAKKCILNKLNMPPNYDLPDLKGDDVKSVVSQSMISQITDGSYQVKPLDDFGNLSNLIEPTQRLQGGGWIMDSDLSNAFQNVMVFYDLNKLTHYQSFDYSPDNQILLIQQTVKEEPAQGRKSSINNNNCQLVVSFMARRAQNKQIVPYPSFFLSKFDYQQFKQIKQYKSLNYGLIDSIYLQLENKNHVFKLNSFTPLDYNLQVSCECQFKIMSESQYLMDYESYAQKLLNIEYQQFTKNQYHLLAKYRLSVKKVDSLQVFMRLKQHRYSDSIRIKLIEVQENKAEQLQQNANLLEIEGVERNIMETQMLNAKQMNRVILGKDTHYILLLEGLFIDNISSEGVFELEMLYQAEEEDLQVEQLELNEVQEYSDIYQDNKYGQLFRERLFIQSSDCVIGNQVSLQLGLKMRTKQEEVQQQTSSKGKKGVEHTQEEEKEDREMDQERSIYLQLLEEVPDQQQTVTWDVKMHSIFKVKGHNQVLMSNVQLFPNRSYYLLAGFDLQEDQMFANKSVQLEQHKGSINSQNDEDNNSIVWFLQVFTGVDQNIALAKDNSKETFENEIKKSWETQQPGRAEKSVKERKKYLLKKKQQKNEELTEEEVQILSEQRTQRNKQQEEAAVDQKNTKGKAAVKKVDPKKDTKQAIVEEKVEKPKRELPKSNQHQMLEVMEYLEKMEQERVVQERASHPGLIALRSDEQLKELKETIQMEQEQVQGLLEQQSNKRAIMAKQQLDMCTSLEPIDYSSIDSQLQERDSFRKEYVNKRELENKLLELCKGDNKDTIEFEKQIENVQQLKNHDRQLLTIAQKQLVNLKITQCIDDLNEAMGNFELEKMNQLLEFIELHSISVDQGLIEKAHDIQEEANDNPNFIADKQAEVKKNGKKGKK